MNCPSCNRTLETSDLSAHGFVKVDFCPSCRGCWLDMAALEGTLSGVWTDLDEMGVTVAEVFSDYICPHCTARLVSVNPQDHTELRVDRCPSCHGIWLDNGELEQLRNVLVEDAEQHGTLTERPPGWSALKWMGYRLAHNRQHLPRDSAV